MAYSVNWITKVVSIPTSDLTLVSGTQYQLAMSDFLGEIRRLEAAFTDGLWAPQILDHTNPKVNFAGTTYAGFDEILNGYTIQFTGVATRVDLLGSNNNIIDVLIATGVSVVPSNSQGLQLVSTGSGLSAQQDSTLTTAASNVTSILDELDGIEGTASHKMLMRAMFASICAKMDMTDNGDGTYTMHMRNMADTKDRITVTGPLTGGRTTVSWDMT